MAAQACKIKSTNKLDDFQDGDITFQKFRATILKYVKNLISTEANLLRHWTMADTGGLIALKAPPPDTMAHISIPFSVSEQAWKPVASLSVLYIQTIVQYTVMSMLSYMIDATLEPILDNQTLDMRRNICKQSVAMGLSGLINPTRAGCTDAVGMSLDDVDGYYTRNATVLSRISPSVKVSYASETKQLRLNVTDKASTTEIGFTTTMIQALEHDAYIINANIVRAIMSFVKTGDSSMILRLPDLVREYETTRLLVIVSKS